MARRVRRRQTVISSRMKGFASFSDVFSSGFKSGWKTVRSGWSASSGASASTNDYPIQVVTTSKPDVTITLKDPGVGSGAALWVSDSGTWWSVVSSQQENVGAGDCSSYAPYNPCGSTNPCVGTGGNCAGTGGNCYGTGGGSNPCSGCTNPSSTGTAHSSCLGYNPYVCNPVYYVTLPGYYTCSMYNPSGYCKYGYYTPTTYAGPYGGNCSGGNCYGGYYNYTIPGNYNPCCSGGNPIPYNPCGGTNPYNPCGTYNPYNPCGSGGNCIGTGGNCTSNYSLYPRYLKVFKYASNMVSEMASITLDSITNFAPIRAIKVVISSSNKAAETATITASAFSDTSAVTKIGNDLVYSATGVKIVTNYGIIASSSSYGENKSVSEINISTN